MNICDKKILIIGGSGSLGNSLIKKYINNNKILCYSRDECKHWEMKLKFKNDNLEFTIGDIRDYNRLENTILIHNPDIIIIAAALKHIEKCEKAISECIKTNINGIQNVSDIVLKNIKNLDNLKIICFVSTDKACDPVNVYGMCKAISEKIIINLSENIKNVKCCCVRYGNVLNSRGSILPILHQQGLDNDITHFTLTHSDMTRFIMTLDDSVDLIHYSINEAESGDIIIPKLISMKIIDLINIFSEKYNKPIKNIGLRFGEKMMELLINDTEKMKLKKSNNNQYFHIKNYNTFNDDILCNYTSTINPLNKEQLIIFLNKINML
jgi:UDP-N-acetylglucosamine 4,6-dehydratase